MTLLKRSYKILIFSLVLVTCRGGERDAREGLELLRSGQSVAALHKFDIALQADPDNAVALFGKGTILSRIEVTRPIARRHLESAIKRLKEPELQAEAFVTLLRLANWEQNGKRALEVYEAALAAERPSVPLFLEAIHIPPQKQLKAGDILLKGLQYYPGELKLHLAYAEYLYAKEKKPGAAAAHLQAQIDAGVKDEKLLFAAAEYYYFDKKLAKATELLSSLGPDYTARLEKMQSGSYIRGDTGESNQ